MIVHREIDEAMRRIARLETLVVNLTTMLIRGGVIIEGGAGFAYMHDDYAEIKRELEE